MMIKKSNTPEDIAFRRITESLTPSIVLAAIAEILNVDVEEFRQRRRGSYLRGVAASYLLRYAGQTQREIAVSLNIGSGAAVSQQMKKFSARLPNDRKLRKRTMRIENCLNEMYRVQTETLCFILRADPRRLGIATQRNAAKRT